jgi:class II lanthipeptide synthase
MDPFHERLIVRAATIDELLSDAFEPLAGQKADTDLAARRLAAWCRSCASGDWSLFGRRLARAGNLFFEVLMRVALFPDVPPDGQAFVQHERGYLVVIAACGSHGD